MYIMYLCVNREFKLECKCGLFIVNAESLLYTTTVVLMVSTTFQVLWLFVLLPAKFVALRFIFHPTVCSHRSFIRDT